MENNADYITTFSEFEERAHVIKTTYQGIINHFHDCSLMLHGDMSENQKRDTEEIKCMLMLLDCEMKRYFDFIINADYKKIKKIY